MAVCLFERLSVCLYVCMYICFLVIAIKFNFFLAYYDDMEFPPESGSQEICGSDAVCQTGGML